MAAWAMPCSLCARQVGKFPRAAYSASPRPATLPCPKIAQAPAKYGNSRPATVTYCAASQRIVAWAAVSRTLAMSHRLASGWRRRHARLAPGLDQHGEARGQLGDGRFVVDGAGQPARGRLGENRAAYREALDDGAGGSGAEGFDQHLAGRLQAEQQYAAAQRIVGADRTLDVGPGGVVGGGFEFPPVRLHAPIIELLDRARRGLRIDRAVARGDHLHQQLVTGLAAGVLQPQQLPLLLRAQRQR